MVPQAYVYKKFNEPENNNNEKQEIRMGNGRTGE
jgi:hypothetical protein